MDKELYLEREVKKMSASGLSEKQISQILEIPIWRVFGIKKHLEAYRLFDLRTSGLLTPVV